MNYFNVDGMEAGDSVVLLVSATNPESAKWAKRTPVTVRRSETGFSYESRYGMTAGFLDGLPQPNPGHQGLNAHMKTLTGVLWAFEHVTESELVRREYRAERRRVAGSGRSESVFYPKSIYPERYGKRAAYALERARAVVARGDGESYVPAGIWSGRGGADGRVFAAHGESKMRWIEKPESKGLRFVGLAGDLDRHSARGWYCDEYGDSSVSGVVYQLPARGGCVRYLAGYADPDNAGPDGRGPVCLSLRIHESDAPESEYDEADAIRYAARAGDNVAESYADSEKEYRAGYEDGQRAREKAAEALEAGRDLLTHCRDARRLWPMRNGGGLAMFGITETPRDLLRAAIENARAARRDYAELRTEARRARRSNWRKRAAAAARAGAAGDYNLADMDSQGFADGWAEFPVCQ